MKSWRNGLRAYTLAVAVFVIALCVGMLAALMSSAWNDMVKVHREILERVSKLEAKCK